MRTKTALLLLMLALAAGCQGIAPTSRRALDAASNEMQLIRDADELDRQSLLSDLRETLMDWAADLADAELRKAADGGLKLEEAQAVLEKYRGRQAKAQKKVAQMADPLRAGAVVLYAGRPAVVLELGPGQKLKLRLADGAEVSTTRRDVRVKTRALRFKEARELLEGVKDVIKALERRKDAEGALQEKAAQGVNAAVRRAMRGGF